MISVCVKVSQKRIFDTHTRETRSFRVLVYYYVLLLCIIIMYYYYVLLLYIIIMYYYYVLLLYIIIMYYYYVLLLCYRP